MGGYNSSRWHWYTRKTTVEECSKLKVSHYAKATLAQRFEAGEPVYYGESGPSRTAALIARKTVDKLLQGQGRTPRDVPDRPRTRGQVFRITRTACHYGGWRYWLLCPSCGQRCGTLYKPYYRERYACRKCHDLTYRSAQEARHYGGWLGALDRQISRLTRAQVVLEKTDKCRGNSKHFWRLVQRYEELIAGVRDQ